MTASWRRAYTYTMKRGPKQMELLADPMVLLTAFGVTAEEFSEALVWRPVVHKQEGGDARWQDKDDG